eukprot:GDKI01019919.1.p1 GENE.GDKI01019919.1~~GDKI01019919.1.p1  ORF type:complete len:226 (+),score=80.27 GDKI01019919.1:118-795(+)
MPSPTSFKKGFAISSGDSVAGVHIIKATVGHEVVRQNERYEYPITVVFEPQTRLPPKKLLDALQQSVREQRIIYSDYGSPYECHFGIPKVQSQDEDGSITVSSKGWSVRRRDIPTLSQQQKQKEQAAAAADPDAHPDREETKEGKAPEGYRVIKSHFSSSVCSLCSKNIGVGEQIGKPQTGGRGGWSHLRCIWQKQKPRVKKTGGVEKKKQPAAKGKAKKRKTNA